jgi:hypothetical protein
MLHNRYYYAARAEEERRIALASRVLKARLIHLKLATRYDALAEGNRAPVELAVEQAKVG